MSSADQPEPPSESSKPPASEGVVPAAPKKKKKAKLAPPPPMTEEQIDSPTKQTIGMLGVVGIMTLIMFVFARGGCNYHPPKETRDPRKVELSELAHEPKDAAMEFELRYAAKGYGGALELAKGPMLESVKREQAACDKTTSCAKRASELRATVQVAAQLLERDMMRAVVRVTTVGTGGPTEKHIVKLERDQQLWKVVSRQPDDGSFKPRSPEEIMLQSRPGAYLMRQPGMPGTEPAPAASSEAASKPAEKK